MIGLVVNDDDTVRVDGNAVHSTLKNDLFIAVFKRLAYLACRDVDSKTVFPFDTLGRCYRSISLTLYKAFNVGFADGGELFLREPAYI